MVTKVVIDTACNKSVTKVSESHKVFKFGDGRKVIATSKAKLPAQIRNTKCFIKAEIVQEKILLLLSKKLLKKSSNSTSTSPPKQKYQNF